MALGIVQFGTLTAQSRKFPRMRVPFSSVNRKSAAGYDPALQRHHLLPCQLLTKPCFEAMFNALAETVRFDDFRSNGLLLPATDAATLRTGMPLHRGPHRRYNELVIERVGQIEAGWASRSRSSKADAATEALLRLGLLQGALRKRLLSERRRFILNRKDPVGTGFDFTELDAMAETLWNST